MLTEKDYCDYDTCVALNELGITDCGLQYYEKGCPNTLHRNLLQPLTIRTAEVLDRVLAISLYYAQKWLREEKQMVLLPSYLERANVWICEICYRKERLGFGGYNQSYEEALSEGVRTSIKILQDEQKENN